MQSLYLVCHQRLQRGHHYGDITLWCCIKRRQLEYQRFTCTSRSCNKNISRLESLTSIFIFLDDSVHQQTLRYWYDAIAKLRILIYLNVSELSFLSPISLQQNYGFLWRCIILLYSIFPLNKDATAKTSEEVIEFFKGIGQCLIQHIFTRHLDINFLCKKVLFYALIDQHINSVWVGNHIKHVCFGRRYTSRC